MNNYKYKEVKPEDTIRKIRSKLNTIGIIPLETDWFNSADGFFSVRIEIPGTDIGTNGKGTTESYALASAYAELMERLQNMAPFKLSIDLDNSAYQRYGFYFISYERKISVDYLLKSKNEWIKEQIKNTIFENDIKELEKVIILWNQISYCPTKNIFIGTPIMDLETKKITYIPQIMLSKMYMSNGMCAGNTRDEALVQGLSEVVERYVNKKIIKDKITPPDIPLEFLQKHPNIIKMINAIEDNDQYKVYMKDCSLGENLPVVGVLLYNKDKQSYFVKFGAFPDFEIAAERTLTEMLQGQNIMHMKGLSNFLSSEYANSDENILGILTNGIGQYPMELFNINPTYKFNSNIFGKFQNNSQMLDYYFNLFKEKRKKIFIKNVSYLNFPTYQVIIPKFSEIERFNDKNQIKSFLRYKQIKNLLISLSILKDEEKKELINLLENMNINMSPAEIIGLPMTNQYPDYYQSVGQLLTHLYCEIGDFDRAFLIYQKWLNQNIYNPVLLKNKKKFFELSNYLKLKKEKKEIQYIKNFMNKYYENESIENSDYNSVYNNYETIDCFNCDNCKYKNKCNKKNNRDLYITLKKEILKVNNY